MYMLDSGFSMYLASHPNRSKVLFGWHRDSVKFWIQRKTTVIKRLFCLLYLILCSQKRWIICIKHVERKQNTLAQMLKYKLCFILCFIYCFCIYLTPVENIVKQRHHLSTQDINPLLLYLSISLDSLSPFPTPFLPLPPSYYPSHPPSPPSPSFLPSFTPCPSPFQLDIPCSSFVSH